MAEARRAAVDYFRQREEARFSERDSVTPTRMETGMSCSGLARQICIFSLACVGVVLPAFDAATLSRAPS